MQDPAARWVARDAIVNASAHFKINDDSTTTSVTLDQLARTGYNRYNMYYRTENATLDSCSVL